MNVITRALDAVGRRLFAGSIEREVRKARAMDGENDYGYGSDADDSATPLQTILSTAYRNMVWTWACMSVIAFDCAQVPPVIKKWGKRTKGKREAEVVDDHEAYQVLENPNAWQSWTEFCEEYIWNLLQWGRVVAEKGRGGEKGDGHTRGFKVLPSGRVDIHISADPQKLFDSVRYRPDRGGAQEFDAKDVVFVKRFDVGGNRVKGISPVEVCRHPILVDRGMQDLTSSVIENSPWASFVLSQEGGGNMTPTQVLQMYAQIDSRLRGPTKAGRPLFIDKLKPNPVRSALADIPFRDLGNGTRDQVLAAWGVPPTKLGILEYASYANAEEMDLRYWRQTIPPWLNLICAAFTRQWLEVEYPGYFLAPDYAAMGVGTSAQREDAKVARDNWTAGVMRLNEARAKIGLQADDDAGTGNKYRWQLQSSAAGFPPSIGAPADAGGETSPFGEGKDAGPAADEIDKMIREEDGKFVVYSHRTGRKLGTYATRDEAVAAIRAMHGRTDKSLKPLAKRRLDDDDVLSMRKGLDDVIDARAGSFVGYALKLFRAQEDEVVKATAAAFGVERIRKAGEPLDAKALTRKYADIFNRMSMQYVGDLADAYIGTVKSAADSTISTVGFELDFNVRNPEITKWLSYKVPHLAAEVNKTTLGRLTEEIGAGLDAGEDYGQIEKRVRDVFGDALDPKLRPATIARTEGIDAANFGAVETFRQSGVVKGSEWLATLDDRCRETHKAANGQTRTLGDPFDVGASRLRWPGDSELGADAEEVCGCRCTVVPILD